jgi:hypothetical protein
MSRKSSQPMAREAPSDSPASAWESRHLLILTATITLLFVLTISLASCDATSIVRLPTPTPTPIPVITEFVIPTPQSLPLGITSGPDGALWFTFPSQKAPPFRAGDDWPALSVFRTGVREQLPVGSLERSLFMTPHPTLGPGRPVRR